MIKKYTKKTIYLFLILSLVLVIIAPLSTNAQISVRPTYYLYQDQNDANNIFEGAVTQAAVNCAAQALAGGLVSMAGGALSSMLGFDLSSLTSGDFSSIFDSGLSDSLSGITGMTVPVDAAKLNSITKKIQGDTGAQVAKDVGKGGASLDSIAYCMANQTLQGLVVATADWVNSGFGGNPIFVNNPRRHFGNIADYELERFLDSLTEDLLCVNIRVNLDDIKRNLLTNYMVDITIPRCLLGTIDIEIDANGNIINGNGWDAWFAYTTDPRSNYYGAQADLEKRLNKEIAEAQTQAKIELDWNNGYQSIRNNKGEITKPGSLVQSMIAKATNIPIERLSFADEFDEILNGLITGYLDNFTGGE